MARGQRAFKALFLVSTLSDGKPLMGFKLKNDVACLSLVLISFE